MASAVNEVGLFFGFFFPFLYFSTTNLILLCQHICMECKPGQSYLSVQNTHTKTSNITTHMHKQRGEQFSIQKSLNAKVTTSIHNWFCTLCLWVWSHIGTKYSQICLIHRLTPHTVQQLGSITNRWSVKMQCGINSNSVLHNCEIWDRMSVWRIAGVWQQLWLSLLWLYLAMVAQELSFIVLTLSISCHNFQSHHQHTSPYFITQSFLFFF